MSTLRESLGELPLASALPAENKDSQKDSKDKVPPSPSIVHTVSTRVLADGTYLLFCLYVQY